MNAPRPTRPASVLPPRKPPGHNPLPIILGVAAVLAIAILIAGRDVFFGAAPDPAPRNTEIPRESDNSQRPDPAEPPIDEPAEAPAPIIDDDGTTMWVSPTQGQPLKLAYLAPGAQIIVSLRPAAILKQLEGERVLAALGPLGQQAIRYIEHTTSIALAEMIRLVIGCQTGSDSEWQNAIVVQATKPIASETILAKHPGAAEKEHGGKKFWLAGDNAYYFPTGNDKTLVVAPQNAIHDVIDLDGESPPLRRDIERLLATTDADRHVSIIFAPNSLFGEGSQRMFTGDASRLREPLFWFLGDELSGAAVSMHWDDNFFLELAASPTLETSPEKAARIFSERVAQIPDKLEEYVVGLNPQPYGRLVVARLPEMVRKLAAYTRGDQEGGQALLRCYLPAVAGHNLLLAAELTLAEAPSVGSAIRPAMPVASAEPPQTDVRSRLSKVTSLKFARDTLESAVEQLSQDIGATIVIRGSDLQADGITKNQSFGIDVSNQPAKQILVEILRLANPDKSASGPNDARQKLVYIFEQQPDKTEQIVVTTRAKAAERQAVLPDVFRVAK